MVHLINLFFLLFLLLVPYAVILVFGDVAFFEKFEQISELLYIVFDNTSLCHYYALLGR